MEGMKRLEGTGKAWKGLEEARGARRAERARRNGRDGRGWKGLEGLEGMERSGRGWKGWKGLKETELISEAAIADLETNRDEGTIECVWAGRRRNCMGREDKERLWDVADGGVRG